MASVGSSPFCLLRLQQARVAGDAHPVARFKDPSIGEPSQVFVRLTAVGSFGVIDARDDRGLAIEVDLYILNRQRVGHKLGVADVGQKLRAVADFAIVFGVDEAVGDESLQRTAIATYLRFIPEAFENHKFAALGAVIVICALGKRAQRQ